jgi:MYXO-CTERM domain-containing protein
MTYFGFFFQAIPSVPPLSFDPESAIATANTIHVTPPTANSGQFGFFSEDFVVQAGDSATYLISYFADPPPDILPGFDLGMSTDTPVAPGSATIDAIICTGGYLFSDACTPVQGASGFRAEPYILQVFHLGLPLGEVKLSDSVVFDPKTNYINVSLRIILDGGPEGEGGSSQITGLTTSTGPQPPQEVPEAGTWALVAAGLVGLNLARRRRS